MLLIVQKIITLSLLTVKLYTCQWPGVIPQLYSSFRVLTYVTEKAQKRIFSLLQLKRLSVSTAQKIWSKTVLNELMPFPIFFLMIRRSNQLLHTMSIVHTNSGLINKSVNL